MAAPPPADTLQPVELADGVEIHLRVAGPAVRSVAWLVDLLIYIGLFLVLNLVLGLLGVALGERTVQGVLLLMMFLMSWFYNVMFEMSGRAATPGQRMMKLKVASISGTPVRLPQSLIRNLLRVVDMMPGFYLFGLVCCLFNGRFQRLGDLVADTVVVYAETEATKPPDHRVLAEPLPPPLVLNREEQAALLQFLDRAPQWSDARKVELTDLLMPLTNTTGMSGLRKACGMGLWLRHGGQEPILPPTP